MPTGSGLPLGDVGIAECHYGSKQLRKSKDSHQPMGKTYRTWSMRDQMYNQKSARPASLPANMLTVADAMEGSSI